MAAHLRAAAEVAEAHEGVASVLLAALEPHVKVPCWLVMLTICAATC